MKILDSFFITLSMLSRFPVPQREWKAEHQRLSLALLPAIGPLLGLVLLPWSWLSQKLALSPFLRGTGLALLPLLAVGGVHLDGFCDTVDALSSHGAPEKKRAILKDPHIGAFAGLYGAGYLILLSALCSELPAGPLSALILGLLFTLSRALGAFLVLLLPRAGETGLGATFQKAAENHVSLGILSCFCAFSLAFLLALAPLPGLGAALSGLLSFFYTKGIAQKEFSGMSGDLAGFSISLAELLMLLAYILLSKAVA